MEGEMREKGRWRGKTNSGVEWSGVGTFLDATRRQSPGMVAANEFLVGMKAQHRQ